MIGIAITRGCTAKGGLRSAGFGTCVLLLLGQPDSAFAQHSEADLARAAQNPVAAMISLPFQNNTFFGIGPDYKTAKLFNIQPVAPFTAWRHDYNRMRPHSALANATPAEFAERIRLAEEAALAHQINL